MRNQCSYILCARNGSNGVDLYIQVGSRGEVHYLTTRRRNNDLYNRLKDGVSLEALKRFKPRRNPLEQKYYRSLQHLAKVADSFIRYEL